MRLLVSWVRDFVEVTAPAQEIADTLALRGFEVAAIEHRAHGDAVIDFEVTANRPDCLSVLGLAREIGAAYRLPVRLHSPDAPAPVGLAAIETGESSRVSVRLEDAELCPRYVAGVAEVTPATSPAWMTFRLEAAGVRPISPIVDITNYVLMELGHPMHAFDLDALAEREIVIRRAAPGEPITTLDGAERTLDADMLVIADAHAPQAVAGVMGGSRSEVSDRTRAVVFESASFKPASVRRTSKRLGLKSEASSRFERGTDINVPLIALQRAVALMQTIGAGRLVGPAVDRYPQPRGASTLRLRRTRLGRLLGLEVPDEDVVRILRALGLAVEPASEGWTVSVPTFRVDLLREVDLIEEVGRHFGFDRLEATFPVMTAAAAPPDPRVSRDAGIRRLLAAQGLSEAVTFAFIEAKTAEPFATNPSDLVAIANPLSAKFDVLRPSLVPGLLDAVARNRRHGRRDVGLFEIGTRVTAAEGETRGVGLAWTGSAAAEHWSRPPAEVDFFDLKGAVELLGRAMNVSLLVRPAAVAWLAAGQSAEVVAGDRVVGVIGRVRAALVEQAGAPRQDAVFAAELDVDRIAALAAPRETGVRPLPRHPFVVRDLSIVVSESLPAEIIRGTIRAAGEQRAAPLVAIAFFDRYQGKGVPDGSVSISVRLTFQAADRTLTDAEVQEAFDTILSALAREHGAAQR